jgi:hypothetical protein
VSPDDQTMTLLALEKGAEWPSWAMDLRRRAKDSAVELQASEETSYQFERRVRARLETIAVQGRSLRAVGYVCSVGSLGRMRARREICDLFLSHLSAETSSELIVSGGAWDAVGKEGDERRRVMELWTRLSESSPGPLVSVRFESDPSDSGVFYAANKLYATSDAV